MSSTFTPGVEQDVDVIVWMVCGNSMAARAGGFHRQLISADGGRGRRVHLQLDPAAFLLQQDSLPPAVLLQVLLVLHQRDADLGSLGHGWQRP